MKMETVRLKKRGENWSNEEKEILRNLISNSSHIIENKCTKTNINIMKTKEWQKITETINEVTGKQRTTVELKLAWKRMKLAAKAHLSAHRQEQMRTGGGEKPPSPSPEDLEVVAIAPFDFEIEVNDYDSDAPMMIPKKTLEMEVVEQSCSTQTTEQGPNTSKSTAKNIEKPKSNKHKETIVESNLNYKKRNLEMMEAEHKLSTEILKLKIEKLKLKIEILQAQRDNLN